MTRARFLPALLAASAVLALAAQRAEAQANGVLGEYFDQLDFAGGAVGTRVDPTISFDWGSVFPSVPPSDPWPPGITTGDTWTARWSGVVQAPVTGVYVFRTTADDGVRVWVDGRLLVDRWRDQSVTSAAPQGISLVAGQRYGLRVEYFENPGFATCRLEWQVPGTGVFAIVPTTSLFTAVAAPKVSPATGTYSDSVTVTLTCDTFGSEIRYTTNNTPPTGGSTLYTGPFVVAANTTVRAIGRRPATILTDSAEGSAVFTVNDILRPAILNAQTPTATQVVVVFSEAVTAASAQNAANYAMTGGVTIGSAVLSGDLHTVFLTTSAMTPGTPYALTVTAISDLAAPPHLTAPGTGIAFVFPVFPSASLTNYYPFEEGMGGTTADLVGANTGTLSGPSGLPTWILGYLGRGLSFDGVDDQLTLVASLTPVLGAGNATLACWIRTAGQGNIPVRAPAIAGGVIAANATDVNDMMWGWLDENGRIGITAGTTIDFASNPEPVPPNGQPNTAQSANPINDNQWHHVAFTRNMTTGALQVYVDGLLSGSGTGQAGALTAVCQSIGHINNAAGSAGHPVFLLGDLDDLRIFNTVLTASQIQSFANRPPAVNAGPDLSVDLGQAAALNGSVIDDGFPTPSTITPLWTGSGPGAITFANANAVSTTATFSAPGIYVLRLTVSDGQLATSDDVIVSYAMITVTPLSITTTEAGAGTAMFSVVLNVAPLANVTIAVSSSNTAEGTVSTPSLVFAAAGVPQIVTVTGVDDTLVDGDIVYTIVLGPAVSADPAYNGYNASDVVAVNINDDFPPLPKKVWGHCGGTGAEAIALLALLGWIRRRRRTAS